MVAFVYLLISAAIGVALCESDICETRNYHECGFHELMPKDYPDTLEELEKSCKDLQQLAGCYLNYLETCPDDILNTPEFQRLLHFILENCQEDSDLYHVISRNLNCFTPTIRSLEKECAEGFIEESDYENLMGESGISFLDFPASRCLGSVWMITCKSQLLGKRCEAELGEAVLNILRITDYEFANFCKTDVLSNLSLLIQAIEMTVSEGKWLEEINNNQD